MDYASLAWRTGRAAGIVAVLAFLVSVLAARSFYPGPYSPFTNWISDLGNPERNPEGAKFLNAGFIITGIAFFPFCLGLYRWHAHGKGRSAVFVLVALAGFYAALSMVMIGVFPENYATSHWFWAVSLFGSLGFFLLLSAFHLLVCRAKDPAIRRIAYCGFAAFLIDAMFGLVFYDRVFEWAAALASFAYVSLLVYAMYRKS